MEQAVIYLITGYLLVMSVIGFAVMGIDKQRAKRRAWRIPELTLLLIAFLGGGLGAFLGMYVFRHKTRHIKFVTLLPIAAGLDVILLLKIYQII